MGPFLTTPRRRRPRCRRHRCHPRRWKRRVSTPRCCSNAPPRIVARAARSFGKRQAAMRGEASERGQKGRRHRPFGLSAMGKGAVHASFCCFYRMPLILRSVDSQNLAGARDRDVSLSPLLLQLCGACGSEMIEARPPEGSSPTVFTTAIEPLSRESCLFLLLGVCACVCTSRGKRSPVAGPRKRRPSGHRYRRAPGPSQLGCSAR